ncbi:MAG: PIN domain-containing protein [Nitrospirae bacterium]|nr:MAG: PIN domain-containing protein [Nitrospirota bacterium]
MSGHIFVDTNVLVYLFDAGSPTKQQRAREIFSNPEQQQRLVLSTQVLQEFYVAVTRRLAVPLDPATALRAVQDLAVFPVIQIDPPLILLAIKRSQSVRLSFWDALILETAFMAGATLLYSEDYQDGQVIGNLRIVNPFTRSR